MNAFKQHKKNFFSSQVSVLKNNQFYQKNFAVKTDEADDAIKKNSVQYYDQIKSNR